MSGRISFLDVSTREKVFAEKLHNKDNTKEYVSGFKDVDSRCYIKCLKCNTIYSITATLIRNKANYIYCQVCEDKAKLQRKLKKKSEIIRQQSIKKLKRNAEKSLDSEQIYFTQCKHCGKYFIGKELYCSQRCRDRQHEHIKSRRRIEKAKLNGSIDTNITLDKLINRDKNICYLCGKECNINDYTYQNNYFIAGNYYPSIEHIIPLAKGGTHTWGNIKLAHRICNSLKQDKI